MVIFTKQRLNSRIYQHKYAIRNNNLLHSGLTKHAIIETGSNKTNKQTNTCKRFILESLYINRLNAKSNTQFDFTINLTVNIKTIFSNLLFSKIVRKKKIQYLISFIFHISNSLNSLCVSSEFKYIYKIVHTQKTCYSHIFIICFLSLTLICFSLIVISILMFCAKC